MLQELYVNVYLFKNITILPSDPLGPVGQVEFCFVVFFDSISFRFYVKEKLYALFWLKGKFFIGKTKQNKPTLVFSESPGR